MSTSSLLPPTSRLPPICKISSSSCATLLDALEYLRSICVPEVRGSRRHRVTDNGNENNTISKHSELPLLAREKCAFDPFERAYTIRWLTCLVSQSDSPEFDASSNCDGTLKTSGPRREEVLENAASLLAICAGTASAGTFTRAFSFASRQLLDGHIQVQLSDAPLENHDFSSVGAQTWGSACVLAESIVDNPETFGLVWNDGNDMGSDFRVLELGAGTGLVSVTLGKLLEALPGWRSRKASIFATDFNPSVLANLRSNVMLNFPTQRLDSTVSVTTHFMDWSEFHAMSNLPSPFDEPFDLILGADIVYELQHATWIKGCLEKLLSRNLPSSSTAHASCLFHLVIPLRATHSSESSTVETVFLHHDVVRKHRKEGSNHPPELGILSKGIILCDADGDIPERRNAHGNQVEYAYYKIGWC